MLDAIADAHNRLCGAAAVKPPGHPSIAGTTTAIAAAATYGTPDLVKLASALAALDADCDYADQAW